MNRIEHRFRKELKRFLWRVTRNPDSLSEADFAALTTIAQMGIGAMDLSSIMALREAIAAYFAGLAEGTASVVSVGDYSDAAAAQQTQQALENLQGLLAAIEAANAQAAQDAADIELLRQFNTHPSSAEYQAALAALGEMLAQIQAQQAEGTTGGVVVGDYPDAAASQAADDAMEALGSGFGAFFAPMSLEDAGIGTLDAPWDTNYGEGGQTSSLRGKLIILASIAALTNKLALYIYQRKTLIAAKEGKMMPLLDLPKEVPDKFIDEDGNYKVEIDTETLFANVYRYTAQKSRFIVAAEVQAQKSLPPGASVERGADLWAFSEQEKAHGLFDQFLNEAIGLIGGNIDGNNNIQIKIKKTEIITGGMLLSLQKNVMLGLTDYILMRFYEMAGLADEIKLRQGGYTLAYSQVMGILNLCAEAGKQEAMLMDFMREGAAQVWKRVSGYCPEGVPFIFNHTTETDGDVAAYKTIAAIEGGLYDEADAVQALFGERSALMLNVPQRNVGALHATPLQKKALTLAEYFVDAVYHFALAAWYGMQEDRTEQAKHTQDYERARGGMMVGLCNV
jgi:hypothetical protein